MTEYLQRNRSNRFGREPCLPFHVISISELLRLPGPALYQASFPASRRDYRSRAGLWFGGSRCAASGEDRVDAGLVCCALLWGGRVRAGSGALGAVLLLLCILRGAASTFGFAGTRARELVGKAGEPAVEVASGHPHCGRQPAGVVEDRDEVGRGPSVGVDVPVDGVDQCSEVSFVEAGAALDEVGDDAVGLP